MNPKHPVHINYCIFIRKKMQDNSFILIWIWQLWPILFVFLIDTLSSSKSSQKKPTVLPHPASQQLSSFISIFIHSLNREKRQRELLRVTRENQAVLQRILNRKPEYDRTKWQRDWEHNLKFMDNISAYPQEWWKQVSIIIHDDRKVLSLTLAVPLVNVRSS